MQLTSYTTEGGIRVQREIADQPYSPADDALADALDTRRGVLFSSSFEFPGRYTRWDMGFVDPPLVFTARGRQFSIEALNERGRILLAPIAEAVGGSPRRRPSRERRRPDLGRNPRNRGALSRGAAQPPAFGILGAAGADPSVRERRGPASRVLRRVRLRSGVPVRADAAAPAAARRSARSRALSAGRDPDRRSHAASRRRSTATSSRSPEPRRAGLPRATAADPYRLDRAARPGRARATTARVNMRRWSSGPERPLRAAICSRSWSGSSSPMPAPTRRAWSSTGCGRPTRRPTAR